MTEQVSTGFVLRLGKANHDGTVSAVICRRDEERDSTEKFLGEVELVCHCDHLKITEVLYDDFNYELDADIIYATARTLMDAACALAYNSGYEEGYAEGVIDGMKAMAQN